METEIKPFADIQLADRYVKVFIESDVDEETAKKTLNNFIGKIENDGIIPESKDELDFLIIQNDGIIGSHTTDTKLELHCVWLKDLQLCETVKTIGGDDITDKYKVEIPNILDFYTIPTTNDSRDDKED
jgi:hypothetical protein